jgi:tetratricopeptide (TPR) repeat protein
MNASDGVPIWLAVAMAAGAIAVHVAALLGMSALMMRNLGSVPDVVIFLGIPSGVVPVLIFAYIVMVSASSGMVNFLYGSRHVPQPEELHRARQCAMDGRIGEALAEYQRLLKVYPESAELLLAMGGVLEMNRRYTEAAQCFRGVMKKFARNDETWAQAARRLGHMQREFMGQAEQGRALIQEADMRLRKAGKSPPPPESPRHEGTTGDPGSMDLVETRLARLRKDAAEKPGSPRPLFAAALLLEREGRHEEAADIYRKTASAFRDDHDVWSDAAYRLALLLDNHLDEAGAARNLLGEIVRRAPLTKAGRLAGQRLHLLPRSDAE